jgi:hypothetical protein
MAGEIRPIFTKEAEAQLDKINKEISLIYDNVKQLDKIQLNFKTFKEYTQAVEKQQKSTDQLSASQKKLEKATENLAFAQSQEGKELARLRQLTNQQNKENRDAAKDATTASEGYDRLRLELTKAEKTYRDLAATQGLASEETKKAQEAVQGLRKQIDDINEPIGRFNDNVGNYASAVPGFNALDGALSKIGVSLDGIAENGGGVQATFSAISKGLVNATRSALAFIATPIGAAIAAIASIGIATAAIFKFNQEVAKANTEIEQLTNRTGAAVDRLREQGNAIESAFGKDATDAIKELVRLQDNFGVSSEEAFQIYTDGLARGGASNEEFGDSIREYGVLFAQSGFSAQEFVNILNTGIDLGIYSDKLPDAIKEAGISLKEQTTATQDALTNAFGASFTQEVLDGVNTGQKTVKEALFEIAEESQRVGLNQQQLATITADVFRGAGEDAGGALVIFDALNQSIDLNTEALSDLAEAEQRSAELFNELERAQTEALKSDAAILFGAQFEQIWIKAKTAVFDAISFVRDTISDGIKFAQADFASFQVRIERIPLVFKAIGTDILNILKELANNALQYGQVIGKALTLDFAGAADQFNAIQAVNFELTKTNEITKETETLSRLAYLQTLKNIEDERQGIIELAKAKEESAKAGTGGTTRTGKENEFDVSALIAEASTKNAQALAEAQNELAAQYQNSEIGAQQFIEGLTDLQKEYNALLIQDTIEALEKVLETEKLTKEERAEVLEELAEFRLDLQKNNIDRLEELAKEQAKKEEERAKAKEKREEELAEAEIEREKRKQEAKQIIQELGFETLSEITNEFFARQEEKQNEELAKFQEDQNKRLEYINELEQSGAITEEEASARRIKLEEETARKQTEIKRKQAIQDKAQALFNIAINTAQAAIASIRSAPLAIGALPNPAGIAALAAVIAQGAVQAGIVASRPIPEFYKGTDYSPEGLAYVGERGAELIEYPDGTQRIATQKALEYLPEGTKVKTASETKQILNNKALESEIKGLRSDLRRKKMSVNIDVRNNSRIDYLGL